MKLPIPSLKIPLLGNISRFAKVVIPTATIIGSFLVLVLVVWPKFNEVLKLRSANSILSTRAQNLEQKASKLLGFEKSQLEAGLGYSEALLPSDKQVFSLVAQVERAAGLSGVVLNKVEVSPGTVSGSGKSGSLPVPQTPPGISPSPVDAAAGSTPKVELKVSVSSDYKSFLQFLNNLLAFSRVLVIRDLTLSSVIGGTGETTGQIKTLITIDAYYKPLPAELSSVESPIDDLTAAEGKRLEQVRTSGSSTPPTIPPVQGGRSDLFAPF